MSDDKKVQKASVDHEVQDMKKAILAFVLCSVFYSIFIIMKMWIYKTPQGNSFHDELNTIGVILYPGFIFCFLSAWVVCKSIRPILYFTQKAVLRLAAYCLLSVVGMLLIVAGSQFAINQYDFFSHHHIAFITNDYDDGQYMNCVFLSKDNQLSSSVKIWIQNGRYDFQQQKFTFIDRNGIEYKTHVIIDPFTGVSFDTPTYKDVSLSFDNTQETCHLTWIDPVTDHMIEKNGWFGWSTDRHDLGDWKMSKMMNEWDSRLHPS